MNDVVQEMRLSELESLEVNRRNDVAWPVIPAAVRLFTEQRELAERIGIATKRTINYWDVVSMIGGFALHFFLASNIWEFNVGTLVFSMSVGNLYLTERETKRLIENLRMQRNSCDYQLAQLEVIWRSATACDSFGEIRQFASEFDFDSQNTEFRKWWIKQTVRILERVCGWEKAEFLAAKEAERSAKFEDAMRKIQSTRQQ